MQAPLYELSGNDSARGLSAAIWSGLLQDYVSNDPRFGARFTDDFIRFSTAISGTTAVTHDGYWQATDAGQAGGTYTLTIKTDQVDGVGLFANDGTTAHYGIDARGPVMVVTPKNASDPRGAFAAEFRADFDTADTVFLGLTENTTNLLSATSALPAGEDFIGFYTADGGTTVVFHSFNDNNGGTAVTGSYTIPTGLYTASAYNKWGFGVDKNGAIHISVNGNYIGPTQHSIPSTAVPIELLCPRIIATAGGGTTAPGILVDRVDVFLSAR